MNIFPKYIVLLSFLIIIPNSVSAQTVGYVLEVKGNWYLNDSNTPLRKGDTLSASRVVRVESPNNFDGITIVLANNRTISRRCPSVNCRTPISLPAVSRWSSIGKILQGAITVFIGRGDILGGIFTKSESISESVVKSDDGKAEIYSLTNLEGENCLRWRSISIGRKETFGEWSEPLKLKNDKKISISNLKPGLYEFTFANPRENCLVNYPQSAWILVSSTKNFEKSRKSFDEFKKMTDEWKKETEEFPIREETIVSLLRAHLYNLAKEKNR